MASFRNETQNHERLDYRLLQDGAITMYWRREFFEDDQAWLAAHGYRIHRWDAGAWRSEGDMHETLARDLGFPGYYGRNLDALNECLGELVVPDAGMALSFFRFDAFARRHRRAAEAILDIAEHTSRQYLLFGQRFIVLVQSDDPVIEFHPVGANPVCWNQREWLEQNRKSK